MGRRVLSLLVCLLIFTGMYAEDFFSELDSFPEEKIEFVPEFEKPEIDLSQEKLFPVESICGKSFFRKDTENKLKLIYTFKKDFTYSFRTEFGIMKMTVLGEYEVSENTIILHPKDYEAKVFGIKAENMDIKDSAYEPVIFDCFVISKGVYLGGDFYKRK